MQGLGSGRRALTCPDPIDVEEMRAESDKSLSVQMFKRDGNTGHSSMYLEHGSNLISEVSSYWGTVSGTHKQLPDNSRWESVV